jgi:hypothetical protein
MNLTATPDAAWNIVPQNVRPHWNYFLALERDFETVSRYIEFCPDNASTYSIELAHLLFSAASEVDTLAKCICSVLDPNETPQNINDYRRIIKAGEESETYNLESPTATPRTLKEEHKQRMSELKVFLPRHNLECVPWENWKEGNLDPKNQRPEWWRAYNQVKHQRNTHYNRATLSNAFQALAGLLVMNYFHCRFDLTKADLPRRYEYRGKLVTRRMNPESNFLRFASVYYDNAITEFYSDF